MNRRVERIAHRGANRECTENTLPAFQRAFAIGADGVELDVHATADGVVVVHHDAIVGVSASEFGGVPIGDLSWDQLRTVQLGGGGSVPTLDAVLAATPPNCTVYVEIKGEHIEALVASAVARSATTCAVHSFDHDAIARFGEIAPGVPRGILFERADVQNVDVIATMRRIGARDVWPEHASITKALIEEVHGARGRVIAWTVNEGAQAQALSTMGVDGLCGDDVRLFTDL